MKNIDKLNIFNYTHNQYPEKVNGKTLLPEDIDDVLNIGKKESIKRGKFHCNLLSFYNALQSDDIIHYTYPEFFGWMLNNKWSNEYGFISAEKNKILMNVGEGYHEVRHTTLPEPIGTKIYQMLIENDYGTHFLGAYHTGGIWYISDTNDRGTGVTLDSLKKGDKIVWVKEFVKGASA